ncbi:MAG: hypothetical protein Q8L13_06275 [Bradyrhizobium sp.]|uniref:hypothetical protein n=1 Tax=Bradyrhizobium sp. TaxID=376 RepID=UPI00272FBCD9|nr:hypothetical protein [Bradyrhizobium sp.]MDP1865936.1 hypothetical protein [Bradyrhizobium sp.]
MRFEGCPMAPSMRPLALLSAGVLGIALSSAFPGSLLAQAGSTGGSVGKTEKLLSGTTDDMTDPDRRKGSPSALVSAARRLESGVVVTSATYGGNCGAPRGSVTSHLAMACNGKRSCDYVIDWQIIGDPKRFCGKDYVAEWRCGGAAVRSASVSPAAA